MDPISQKLQYHYTKTIKDHGSCAKGVDWGCDKSAQIRYDQMLDVILAPGEGVSILDVGCGYGGLQNHLMGKVKNLSYKGIDISKEMIRLAKEKNPQIDFITGDYLETTFKEKFDYIICNGILTQKLDASLLEMETYFKKVVKKMFHESHVGCCFNIMSTRVNFFSQNLFYRHPSEILSYCLSEITPHVKINHAYGLYEYTVYLYKEAIASL